MQKFPAHDQEVMARPKAQRLINGVTGIWPSLRISCLANRLFVGAWRSPNQR
jgi:hypothetical protein